jgi:hypothetical protein
MEQDEDYSNKLEKLLAAIDNDHTIKLNKVYNAVCENHAKKLKQIVEKYEGELTGSAKNFKNTLIENISNYLELYIDEAIPAAAINEAVKNRKAQDILANMKNTLAVNEATSNNVVKEAIIDGKKQINEANKKLEAVSLEKQALKEKLEKIEANKIIAEKTKNMDLEKVEKVFKLLQGKDPKFVIENFDYAVKMFEKSEESRLETLAEEAAEETESTTVDRPVIEEKTVTESAAVVTENVDPAAKAYLKELSKY